MATLADVLRGYTPPTESALADPIKAHLKSLPQKFAQNQQNQMDLLSQAFPGNTYESMMTQGDPKAMAELAMQVPFNAMVAYHGTPHNILGKFDISKVGTGEGAQAYGHGMYFAENPAVAKEYQKIVQGPESTAQHYLQMYKTPESAIAALEGGLKPNLTPEAKKFTEDAINVLKSGKELKGNLYKVDIPDEYIPNMMNYYKPLSEQPKAVQDIAWQYKDALKKQTEFKGVNNIWDLDGGDLYGVMQRYQINDSGKLVKKNVDAKDVSNKMLNAGIPGIKYLDQGSLQQSDSYLAKHGGTSNFVVFDPSEVKILEKNSKPVSRKELLEQQVNKLKD